MREMSVIEMDRRESGGRSAAQALWRRARAVGAGLALAGLVAVAGCSDDNTNNNNDMSTNNQTLTDPQSAAVLRAANDGEIQQGNLAIMRALSPAVHDFAMMMVNDHTAANQRQSALFTQRGITPTENSVSMQLTQEATAALMMLNNVMNPSNDGGTNDGGNNSDGGNGGNDGGNGGNDGGNNGDGGASLGSPFDRAYIAVQVTMHTRVLNLLDSTLLPSAIDASLKSEEQTTRAAVASHLSMAQTLQTRLQGQ